MHKRGISRSMTINTLRIGETGRLATGMASSAGEGRSIVICDVCNQAKARIPGVIKRMLLQHRRPPAIRLVASDAVCAKHSCMDFRFSMAGQADRRRFFKLAAGVTLFTGGNGVNAGQGKYLIVGFKGKVGHRIMAVVTVETPFTKDLNMNRHKISIGCLMTIGTMAHHYREFSARTLMAGGAL